VTLQPQRLARLARAASVAVMIAGCAIARPVAAQSPVAIPPINLLYQNFPNPFPNATSQVTCIWFDLAQNSGGVIVAVYDLRGHLVRTIVPSAAVPSALPAGYYGRSGSAPNATGCDPRFVWDGRGSNGVILPPGVYLVRLHVDDAWQTKKIILRGP
jgi:hypothetical protein